VSLHGQFRPGAIEVGPNLVAIIHKQITRNTRHLKVQSTFIAFKISPLNTHPCLLTLSGFGDTQDCVTLLRRPGLRSAALSWLGNAARLKMLCCLNAAVFA
jgi:hypothetical protein